MFSGGIERDRGMIWANAFLNLAMSLCFKIPFSSTVNLTFLVHSPGSANLQEWVRG